MLRAVQTVLAIDPGIRMCGCSLFVNGAFNECWLVRSKKKDWLESVRDIAFQLSYGPYTTLTVIEGQVIYPTDQQKGNPNHIRKTAFATGAYFNAVEDRAYKMLVPAPAEWKGSVPKSIHNERVKAKHPEAIPMVERVAKSYRHNVWDAIGLGDWALKQL